MRMRILYAIPNLSGGGSEQQLVYLLQELARKGHDIHLAYCKEGPQKSELPGVVLYQLKARSNYDPSLLWQLIRLARSINPDIIHTWILQMDIFGGVAARLSGIPWIFRESSSVTAYLPTWKNRLRIRVCSGASAVICNSRGGDKYWKIHLPSIRRYIVKNGLPVHEIDRVMAAFPPGLSKSEAKIVLYVGRLISDSSANKNLKAFLEALVHIRQQQNVLGILCGDGPQWSELEVLRHKLGLTEDVHFTGHLPFTSVIALMKKAAVFVSLSAMKDVRTRSWKLWRVDALLSSRISPRTVKFLMRVAHSLLIRRTFSRRPPLLGMRCVMWMVKSSCVDSEAKYSNMAHR